MLQQTLVYCGLRRPCRFERAIPVVLALFLGLVVIAVAVWFAVIGELGAGGPRALYFLYLLALLALAIAVVRWPPFAGALVVLALVDFAWGVGSWALQPAGSPSLLPAAVAEPERFQWHALLQAVPIPFS